MTFLLALALLWLGVNGLHSPDAAWTAVGAVLLCSLAGRKLLAAFYLHALNGSTEGEEPGEDEPERGHGGRMVAPWS